jgi:hypothetical protein
MSSAFCVPKARPSPVEPTATIEPEPAEAFDNVSLHSDSSYVMDMEQIDSANIKKSVNGLPAELIEREGNVDDTSDEDVESVHSSLNDIVAEGEDTSDVAKSASELEQDEPMDPFMLEDASYLLQQRARPRPSHCRQHGSSYRKRHQYYCTRVWEEI